MTNRPEHTETARPERTDAAAGTGRGGRPRGALSLERLTRWMRRLTAVAVAVAVLGTLLVAAAAVRALPMLPAVAVAALAAAPALVALLVRARAVWLVEAVPNLLDELRAVADRSDASEASGSDRAAAALREQTQQVQQFVARDRRWSLRGLYRLFKLLRSPATQATGIAREHLGDRAAAALTTTTGAASRLAGFVPLAWLAALGTVAVYGLALALLVIGSF